MSTVADLISRLKTSSSQWMKTQGVSGFAWQHGYGAFTLGRSDLDALKRYIDMQVSTIVRAIFKMSCEGSSNDIVWSTTRSIFGISWDGPLALDISSQRVPRPSAWAKMTRAFGA
jgi:hypothetical protein